MVIRVPRGWLQLILAVLHVEKMIGWIVNNFRIERMESIGNHVRVDVRDKAFVKFPSFPLILKGCFALKGIEETRSSAKTQGDTRVWTRDLSICSRMLYHWAISPCEKSWIRREFIALYRLRVTFDFCNFWPERDVHRNIGDRLHRALNFLLIIQDAHW